MCWFKWRFFYDYVKIECCCSCVFTCNHGTSVQQSVRCINASKCSQWVVIKFLLVYFNYCSHIEDVHLLFCAHFMNIFSILGGVELDIAPSKILRWCLLCVICNSNSIQTLRIDCSPIHLRCAPSILCTFDILSYLWEC